MVEADVFEWDVLVKRGKQRKQTGMSQQVYSDPLPKHQVMAFQDEQLPNPLTSKDWDSEANEGLTMKDLLSQFNLTAVVEGPQEDMKEESKVQKANQQFE